LVKLRKRMLRRTNTIFSGKKTKALLELEGMYSAKNYAPLQVMFHKAKGCKVWDVDGKEYLDFLAAYGAVNQGHLHPKIVKAVTNQLKLCTLSSRAFCNSEFAKYAKYVTKTFGYEKVLPMNTGAEGVETALKIARKWGYMVKGIKKDKAIIVCANQNFHGRTFGAIAMSDDPGAYANYGPKLPGFKTVKYGDLDALEKLFKKDGKNIAAYMCEPIQGEAGINIPPKGYLKGVRKLCTKYNILYVDDEVQSGIGRSGKMLAVEHENVRPDVVILAKALGAGILPVAAVLADDKVMKVITPGTHGSTFGGNPLACTVATAALEVVKNEKLVQNSAKMGALLKKELELLMKENPGFITEIRGRGLMCAIVFNPKIMKGEGATRYTKILKEEGILAKTTHGNIIRITPPLTLDKKILASGVKKLRAGLKTLKAEAAVFGK